MSALQHKHLRPPVPEYLILLAIILIGMMARYFLVTYNLPVASNVDERFMLRLFYKFDHASTLNPEFFQYPTLYSYINYFLLRPFIGLKNFLYFGRVLNLMLSGFLAVGVFWLSKQVYRAAIPGLLAAAFTMFSPIIIYSASYVITDIQLAFFSILSLFFLNKFFTANTFRSWLLGVLFMGLAFATKYSAISLILTYFILEIIHSNPLIESNSSRNPIVKFLNVRLSAKYIRGGILIAALICLCVYFFYPSELLLSIVQKSGDLNSVIDQTDRLFVESFRGKFFSLGIILTLLALISLVSKNFTERFGLLRPYVGVVSSGILLMITSPFILISWKKFIYDFGAVMKHSGEGSSSQWISYIERYSSAESLFVLMFLFVGLWHSYRLKNRAGLLVVYLLVSYVTIGAASQGVARYLTPILPVMFIIAAWGIYATGLWLTDRFGRRFLQSFLVLALTVAISIELYPKVNAQIFLPHNDMYGSYTYVVSHKPSKVYYAAYAPDVELRLAGFEVEEIPSRLIAQNNLEVLKHMKSTDFLIVDGEVLNNMNPKLKQQLSLVWQSTSDLKKGKFDYSNQFIFTRP